MKLELKDYQETAATQLVAQARSARASAVTSKHAFVLSAPTGSGKTAIITAVMERLLDGDEFREGDPDATFLWVTDAPELNEQSKKKILASSEVFTPQRVETIDAGFDGPTFEAGKIYFLNTQKLGQATTFTRRNDARTYTLWETISRTASERPKSFYLVVDEAHKGMRRRAAAEIRERDTIIQRLIVGGSGIVATPLLVGISATPKRFNDLLAAATDRVRWPTHVKPEDVRESGLVKDDIILWHTRKNGRSNWALLGQASQKLQEYENAWRTFCKRERRELVRPILVVQVTDGTGKRASNTDLGRAVSELESVLGTMPIDSIGHCFQETGAVGIAPGRAIRKIQPSDIQDDESIRVVFFKMALNTGWDCPRAEVMMSFRRAVDDTVIAQLVGRMVRTPLAQRILSEELLNSVSLYLPNWDDDALNRVINYLTASDDAIPTTVERGENLAAYGRAPGSGDLFRAAALLPTYSTTRANKASNVKRLMQLARYLANDEIDPAALDKARELVLDTLDWNRNRLQALMRALVETVQRADLVETRIALGAPLSEEGDEARVRRSLELETSVRSIQLLEQDIRDLFADAGRRLGAGLHVNYLGRRTAAKHNLPATVARAELCALVNDKETQENLERVAGEAVKAWWAQHHVARQARSPERRAEYARVNRMAAAPEPEELALPGNVRVTAGPRALKKHLYVDGKGEFRPSPLLNRWEELTMAAEFARKDFKGWLRNPVRKEWSLGIPYEDTGLSAVMYPDFLIFRSSGSDGAIVDILEPHAPNQGDLSPKLQGLCKFAERHGDRFGRIELIIAEGGRGKEKLLRVDVNAPDIRGKAKLLTENAQIVALARELNA